MVLLAISLANHCNSITPALGLHSNTFSSFPYNVSFHCWSRAEDMGTDRKEDLYQYWSLYIVFCNLLKFPMHSIQLYFKGIICYFFLYKPTANIISIIGWAELISGKLIRSSSQGWYLVFRSTHTHTHVHRCPHMHTYPHTLIHYVISHGKWLRKNIEQVPLCPGTMSTVFFVPDVFKFLAIEGRVDPFSGHEILWMHVSLCFI